MTKASCLAAILVATLCLLGITDPAAAQTAADTADQANVKTTQYNDWEVRCLEADGPKQCLMNQIVNNPQSGSPIMRVAMKYQPQNTLALMAFTLPLGTHLAPGLRINVPGSEELRIPFQVCFRNGCQAYLGVKAVLMSKLKNGTSFTVHLVGPGGKQISLPVSLMGFTAANDAIAP